MSISSSEAGRNYTQCKLSCGETSQVAWIPSEFAVTGNTVSVREGGERKIWLVQEVHEEANYGDLNKQRLAEKRWREVLK